MELTTKNLHTQLEESETERQVVKALVEKSKSTKEETVSDVRVDLQKEVEQLRDLLHASRSGEATKEAELITLQRTLKDVHEQLATHVAGSNKVKLLVARSTDALKATQKENVILKLRTATLKRNETSSQ
jgi:hypothetical protein